MRRSVLIAAAALAVLAIGIGGGAVMAQESDSEDGSTIKGFVSRVAEILGLEEHTVQDAFTQARQEMMDESIENNLAAMVESGKLTQEQADEIQGWYDDKPDSIGSWSAHPKMLTTMVESGKLTQEQADEIQEWYDDKPDSIASWGGHGKTFGHKRWRGGRGHGGHSWKGKPAPSTETTPDSGGDSA